MARERATSRSSSWRELLVVGTTLLAVGLGASAGAWQLGVHGHHGQHGQSASLVQQPGQDAPPKDGTVQAAALPVASVTAGPAADLSVVVVASDVQAAATQQDIAHADAILAQLGLSPLNDSVLVVYPAVSADTLQQQVVAVDAFRGQLGLAPVQVVDLRPATPAPTDSAPGADAVP